ncbi:MAG: DUF86 domain-containing protein [Candidatus Kapaibacteriales bacterium]
MYNNDSLNMEAIIDSIEKINRYASDHQTADSLFGDEESFEAILMNFLIIGESVGRIKDETKAKYPDISWREIKDFRNLIAHDYFGIDVLEIFEIIKYELPVLNEQVLKILNDNKTTD